MGAILEARRAINQQRLEAFKKDLGAAQKLAGQNACVYLTGSFARGEASKYSDLDLFIVGRAENDKRLLSRLDEICMQAELIEKSREHQFPDFSGDGEYLVHHTINDLIDKMGKPQDDANNTFTARLLLLLESRPLLSEDVYQSTIDKVIRAYWRDYDDHKSSFMPAFLANDILRLWRTFCLNYEASTQTDPAEKKAKRKLKNYKLKHSRLLTCYSALVYLLHVFNTHGTVHPTDAQEMVKRSPTERLEWLAKERGGDIAERVSSVLEKYERFLQDTDKQEARLIEEFLDPDKARESQRNAYELGDTMYELMSSVGGCSRFYRLLVV